MIMMVQGVNVLQCDLHIGFSGRFMNAIHINIFHKISDVNLGLRLDIIMKKKENNYNNFLNWDLVIHIE